MDPIDFLRTVRGRWRIIALTCFVGILAGWVATPGSGEARRQSSGGLVTATHTLILDASAQETRSNSETENNLQVTALLVREGEVPDLAAAALGSDEPAALVATVSATPNAAVGTVEISATSDDPARAAEVANTFAQELLESLDRQAQEGHSDRLAVAEATVLDLQSQLDALPATSSQQESLQRRLDAATLALQELEAQGAAGSGFRTLDEASADDVVPAGAGGGAASADSRREGSDRRDDASESDTTAAEVRPVEDPPNRAVRMLIGGAVGLVLGIGLALLRERLDARIRTKESAEAAFGLPVLAEIPAQTRQQRKQLEIASAANGRSIEAEAYRVLRTSLLFSREPVADGGDGAAGSEHRNGARPYDRGGRGGSARTIPTGPLETVDQLRRAARGLPVLGVVPPLETWTDPTQPRLAVGSDPTSPAAGAYRALRSPLQHLGLTGWLRTLRITSAMTGEGRTSTAANLGLVLARAGHRVTLVDCDFRNPRLHSFFGLSNSVGLASMVSGELSVSATCQAVPGEDRLTVVASGPVPHDPVGLLASPRTAEVLAALAVQSDIVILDTAPVVADDAAAALSNLVDATVIVASRGITSVNRLQQALEVLARSGAPLAGIVFNRVDAESEALATAGEGHRSLPTGADLLPPADGSTETSEPSLPGRSVDVVLVTSPGAEEGKTSTALNLAAALAETGTSVLTLDFDLRRPSIHGVFGIPAAPGLTDALDHSVTRRALHEIVRPTPIPNVEVIPSGTAVDDPAGLLPGGRDLITKSRSEAEVVIVDTPPLLAASDASQLTPAADAVIVVCRAGRTSVHAAARCAEQLARLGAPALGVVLTAAPEDSAYGSYYYSDTLLRPSRWRFWHRHRSQPGSMARPVPSRSPGGHEPEPPAAPRSQADKENGKAPSKSGSQKKSRGKMAKQRT